MEYIFDCFVVNFIFWVLESGGFGSYVVLSYDDVSVMFDYVGKFGVFLVKGSFYIIICVGEGIFVFLIIYVVVGFWVNCERIKYCIMFNNG